MSDRTDVVHEYPVWGDMADSCVRVNDEDDSVVEHLVAKSLGENLYVVCCIPCWVKDIALGDVVEANDHSEFVKVHKASGRYVFRAWSEDGWLGKRKILDEIAKRDGLMETCTDNLLAIDVPSEAKASLLSGYLQEEEAKGTLQYETGKS